MRGFIVVLDSFGVGAAPDATAFGDEGASTIKTISKSVYFNTPNMKKMGLLAIDGVGLDSLEKHNASYGRLRELSIGKDTTTGHWEMAGIVSKKALPTFPNGFPSEENSARKSSFSFSGKRSSKEDLLFTDSRTAEILS